MRDDFLASANKREGQNPSRGKGFASVRLRCPTALRLTPIFIGEAYVAVAFSAGTLAPLYPLFPLAAWADRLQAQPVSSTKGVFTKMSRNVDCQCFSLHDISNGCETMPLIMKLEYGARPSMPDAQKAEIQRLPSARDILSSLSALSAYFDVPKEDIINPPEDDCVFLGLRDMLCWLTIRSSGLGFARVPAFLGLAPQAVHSAFRAVEMQRREEPALAKMLDELEERAKRAKRP